MILERLECRPWTINKLRHLTEMRHPCSTETKPPRGWPAGSRKSYEARYAMLARSHPEAAARLLEEAQEDVDCDWRVDSARAAIAGSAESLLGALSKLASEPTSTPIVEAE
jgi:hypothetical protein